MSTRKQLWSERNGAKLELTSSGFSALAKTAIEKAGGRCASRPELSWLLKVVEAERARCAGEAS